MNPTDRYDAEPVTTAVIAAITAALAVGVPDPAARTGVYDLDKVPGSKWNRARPAGAAEPDRYVTVEISRMHLPGTDQDGTTSLNGWRIVTKAVGRSIAETRHLNARVWAALNDQTLTVGARPTSLVQHETSDPVGPDDGRWSAAERWTLVRA